MFWICFNSIPLRLIPNVRHVNNKEASVCATSGFICPLFLWDPHVALKVALWSPLSDWTSLVWIVRAHAHGPLTQLEKRPCLWALLNYWTCLPKNRPTYGTHFACGTHFRVWKSNKALMKELEKPKADPFSRPLFLFHSPSLLSLLLSVSLSLLVFVYSLMSLFHFTRPHKSRRGQGEMLCFIH